MPIKGDTNYSRIQVFVSVVSPNLDFRPLPIRERTMSANYATKNKPLQITKYATHRTPNTFSYHQITILIIYVHECLVVLKATFYNLIFKPIILLQTVAKHGNAYLV